MGGYGRFFPGAFVESTGPTAPANWYFMQSAYSWWEDALLGAGRFLWTRTSTASPIRRVLDRRQGALERNASCPLRGPSPTTGILITGAIGSAKTSAAQYPFTAQLIQLHAGDPRGRWGADHRREGQLRT